VIKEEKQFLAYLAFMLLAAVAAFVAAGWVAP
jgi:hypothetical protein